MDILPIDDRNRIKTANQMGFMFLSDNLIKQKLRHLIHPHTVIADIGCAYGVDTLESLKAGAKVIAIDLIKNI